MGWRDDDATTELLLAHAPLDDVLRFVIAREDVRTIAAEMTTTTSSAVETMRAPAVDAAITVRVRESETTPAPSERRAA